MSHSFEAAEGQYLLTSCPLPPYKDLQGGTVAVRLSFFDDFLPDESFSSYYSGASGDISWNACSQNPFTIFCVNVGKELYIYSQESQNIPIDRRVFKSAPTCHAFRRNSTDASLLVGLSTGEVHLIYPTRRDFGKIFNEEKSIDKSSVTCLNWVPNSPNQFVVSHLSGSLYLYDEKLVAVLTSPTYEPFKETIGFSVYTCKTKSTRNPLYRWVFGNRISSGSSNSLPSMDFPFSDPHPLLVGHNVGSTRESAAVSPNHDLMSNSFFTCFPSGAGEDSAINQIAFSPCGLYLAVVTQDGYLRVVTYHAMELYGYMRSYFAGLLCVDWSPDSRYIAVGGQDDLVTLWSMFERTVICRCEGHRSWVSTVRFDPFLCPSSNNFNGRKHDNSVPRKDPDSRMKSLTFPDTQSTAGAVVSQSYRLGSVGQDTMFCLWDVAEDIIRQSLSFTRDSPHQVFAELGSLHTSGEPKSRPCGSASTVPPLGRNTMRSSAQAKFHSQFKTASSHTGGHGPSVRHLLGFLTLNKRKSSRTHPPTNILSQEVDSSANLRPSANRRTQTLNRGDMTDLNRFALDSLDPSNGESSEASTKELCIFTDLSDKYILGSPMCPRFEDVPVLEPLVCTVMHQHRLTDLVFRRDTVHVVCQQGLIRCWSRPNRVKHTEFAEENSNESDSFSGISHKSNTGPPPCDRIGAPIGSDASSDRSSEVPTSERYYCSPSQQSPCLPSTGRSDSRCDYAMEPKLSQVALQRLRTGRTFGSPTSSRGSPLKFNYSGVTTDGSRLYETIGSDVNCTDV